MINVCDETETFMGPRSKDNQVLEGKNDNWNNPEAMVLDSSFVVDKVAVNKLPPIRMVTVLIRLWHVSFYSQKRLLFAELNSIMQKYEMLQDK